MLLALLLWERASAQPPQQWTWANATHAFDWGLERYDRMCVDHSGNVIAIGQFVGTITFGNVTLTAAGSEDLFLVKYDPAGNLLWARNAGGANEQYWDLCTDVCTDDIGNIYLLGYIGSGPALYDGVDLAEGMTHAAFLMKCAPDGHYLWSHRLNSGWALCLAITSGGIIHAFASDGNSVKWIRYDNAGSFLGEWSIGLVNMGGAPRAACTTDGGVILGFSSDDQNFNLDPGGGPHFVYPNNSGCAVVVKYSAAGVYQWHHDTSGDFSFGGRQTISDLAVDADDNTLLVVQDDSNPVDFAGFQLPYQSSLVKLGSDGTGVWSLRVMVTDTLGNSGDLSCYRVAVDTAGSVYVSGPVTWVPISGESINGYTLPTLTQSSYIAKFHANGTALWSVAPAMLEDYTLIGWSDIAVRIPDALVVAGVTTHHADFPPFEIDGNANQMLIAQLGPSKVQFNDLIANPLLFPVPANDRLNVSAPNGTLLSVYDMSGRLVMQEQLGTNGWLDVVHLPSGAYQLQMDLNDRIAQSRFIIAR